MTFNSSPFPTRLKTARLVNFRNIPFREFEFEGSLIELVGPNGVGKTNVLEALSFLSPGRGLRRARLEQILTWPHRHPIPELLASGWGVQGQVTLAQGEIHVATGVRGGASEHRHILLDDKELTPHSRLDGLYSMLWLTPAHDRLLAEGMGGRRKFLDRLLQMLDPTFGALLHKYDYHLKERQKLLRFSPGEKAWLFTLEEKLGKLAIELSVRRQSLGEQINKEMDQNEGPFPHVMIAFSGTFETWILEEGTEKAYQKLRSALEEGRIQEAQGQGTPPGPHATEPLVTFVEKSQEALTCSTGEQKALLISLLLAFIGVHSHQKGSLPLLLLDEGGVHLDRDRQRALLETLLNRGVQTFFTDTEAGVLKDQAQVIELRY